MTQVPSTTIAADREAITRDDRDSTSNRPRGHLQPTDDRACRAIKAIGEQRFDDAAKHISALSEDSTIDRAWKLYLSGCFEWARHDLATAEKLLDDSIKSLTSVESSGHNATTPNAHRLSATAHELLGSVLRRQDRPDEAYQHHLTACQQREKHGSHEELWESASSIGLDSLIMHQPREAVRWHEQALKHAEQCMDDNRQLVATAWTNLSNALIEDERFAEAVDAARKARECWHNLDPTAPSSVIADAKLGAALLHHGESICGSDHRIAGEILSEAVLLLDSARVSLFAFGTDFTEEARECAARLDFANRLLASVNP